MTWYIASKYSYKNLTFLAKNTSTANTSICIRYTIGFILLCIFRFGTKIPNKMGEYLCVDIAGVQQEVFETCCHELFPLAQNRISFS